MTNNEFEDLCVTRLHESTVDRLDGSCRFLRLTDMMSKVDPRQETSLYFLFGYPSARFDKDEDGVNRTSAWKYITVRYPDDYTQVENYNPEIHLVLKYQRGATNSTGEVVHPPGMSGCGMWSIGMPVSHSIFRPEDFRLVGIQNAWHKSHEYAKGTWIDNVMRIIWRYFPDARGPMRLHGMAF